MLTLRDSCLPSVAGNDQGGQKELLDGLSHHCGFCVRQEPAYQVLNRMETTSYNILVVHKKNAIKLISVDILHQSGVLRVSFGKPGPMEMLSVFPDGFKKGKSPLPGLKDSNLVPPPPQPSFFTVNVILQIKSNEKYSQ